MFLVIQDFMADLPMWPCCEKTKKTLKRKKKYFVMVWSALENI
jgi:hypothetical protein